MKNINLYIGAEYAKKFSRTCTAPPSYLLLLFIVHPSTYLHLPSLSLLSNACRSLLSFPRFMIMHFFSLLCSHSESQLHSFPNNCPWLVFGCVLLQNAQNVHSTRPSNYVFLIQKLNWSISERQVLSQSSLREVEWSPPPERETNDNFGDDEGFIERTNAINCVLYCRSCCFGKGPLNGILIAWPLQSHIPL